jgi:hypothetical protein
MVTGMQHVFHFSSKNLLQRRSSPPIQRLPRRRAGWFVKLWGEVMVVLASIIDGSLKVSAFGQVD